MSWRNSPSTSTGHLLAEPRIETIRESSWSTISLTPHEEELLLSAGKALARGTDRYGVELTDPQASLVQVRRVSHDTAQVRVLDAVGIVASPTLQLNVQPKIPVPHLLHILQAANVVPRLADGEGLLEKSDNLAVLIAHWFVTAAERVLEEGLARDYREHRAELTAVRGRILPLATARLYYRGRPAVLADYEEYDFDTPLNRVLLHVARIVAAGAPLPETLRRRALRASKRMDGVGWFRRSDVAASVDRRTSYYNVALTLAHEVLAGTGRTLDVGASRGWTFLFRTPDPVEAGVRALIAESLELVKVGKGKLPLAGSTLTINPDLVFDDPVQAVGDVKYKLIGAEWDRHDLYQVVAFAAGYRVERAVLALFLEPGTQRLPTAALGDHAVTQVCWPADGSLSAADAAQQFCGELRAWYFGEPDATPVTS